MCRGFVNLFFLGGQTKFRSILASTSWVKGRKHIDYKQLLNVNASFGLAGNYWSRGLQLNPRRLHFMESLVASWFCQKDAA